MNKRILTSLVVVFAVTMAGCASYPENIDELETARMEVQAVEKDPMARDEAAVQLRKARDGLQKAEQSFAAKKPVEIVQHEAYIANQHAQIAKQQIAEAEARRRITSGEAERNKVLLHARAEEAERAVKRAEQRAREAELARAAADAALAEARRLDAELKDLQARQTERGLVLTLGDVLFDTDRAELRVGAAPTIDRVAEFLREYKERNVLIEGHTDARGSDAYNAQLSQQRANAVREALLDRGTADSRIRTRGLGEAYPVASNNTQAGMQQNRRVEIVISDEKGAFPAAAERAADR